MQMLLQTRSPRQRPFLVRWSSARRFFVMAKMNAMIPSATGRLTALGVMARRTSAAVQAGTSTRSKPTPQRATQAVRATPAKADGGK